MRPKLQSQYYLLISDEKMKHRKEVSHINQEESKEPSICCQTAKNQLNLRERQRPLTFFQHIEKDKAKYKKKCKYGFGCIHFPCNYWHEREEYLEIELIATFRELINQNAFEEICKYNIGDADVIDKIKKKVMIVLGDPVKRTARFLRLVEEKKLLMRSPLKIEVEGFDKSKMKNRILSYILARVYILYYRDEITQNSIPFELATQYILLALSPDLPSDVLIALMFHTSRAILEKDANVILEGILIFQSSLTESNFRNLEAEEIINNAEKLLKEKLINTSGFKKGIQLFINSLGYPSEKLENALQVIKSLKIKLFDNDNELYGMCGLNHVIYIAPKCIWEEIDDKQTKIARALAVLIHVSGHHLMRDLKGGFEAITPRGDNEYEKLEAGYRLEYFLFGEFYKYKYWNITTGIMDDKRWVDVPFSFEPQEMFEIKKRCREIRNKFLSGIDAGIRAKYE